MNKRVFNVKNVILLMLLAGVMVLTGCRQHVGNGSGESAAEKTLKALFGKDKNEGNNKTGSYGRYNENGEFEITEEEMWKILDESGYGEGVDWSKQSYDDPSIPKSMDITSSKEAIRDAYYAVHGSEFEPGDSYEKAWWEYIPDSYILNMDEFPATANYAGEEKDYNSSLEQTHINDSIYTTGQERDLNNVENIAKSFIYEEMKNKYRWTDNLDDLCVIANSLGVADFYSKQSDRPMWHNANEEWMSPGFMTAYYNTSTVGYSKIGIPKFGGYSFTITVWEDLDEPVGWVDEIYNTGFVNADEVYENMGEWDFYDELDATDHPTKVVKPKLPNGAVRYQGKSDKLSREQYVYKKIGDSGSIYYYGNGITVDMTFYGGEQGGNFKDALKYCQKICHND